MKRNSSKPKRRYGDAGFTLVELVVVIAVLAILAGVGAVAYNGYIEYTKKGVDRQTVGEINHALELANYDDPSLFTEQGTLVFLTDTGLTSLDPNVVEALKNTFGDDLSTVKLTSEKWTNAFDGERFNRIANSIGITSSYVDQYWTNGKTSSFAGNISSLWDKVRKLMDARNAMVENPDEKDEFLLRKAVSVSTGENASAIKDMWSSSNRLFETPATDSSAPGIGKGDGSSAPLAVEVARSFAFISYAEKLDTVKNDPDLSLELAEFKASDALIGESYFNSLENSKWSTIFTDYQTNQAEADSLAYLGLMEVAMTIEDDIGTDNATNDVFYDAITGYVGMTESMMASKENFESAKTILASSSNGVSATVKKSGDGINIIWSVDDIDPRKDDSGSASAADPAVAPTQETTNASADFTGDNQTLTTEPDNGVIALKSGNVLSIEVAVDSGVTVTKINFGTEVLDATPGSTAQKNCNVDSGSINLKINRAGVGVVSLTAGSEAGTSSNITLTYTLSNGKTKTISFVFWTIE